MTEEAEDAETIAAFTALLDKVGGEWLKKQQPVSPSLDNPDQKGLIGYLREALKESTTERNSLRERLEAMRDLLTPEQLIRLKSPGSANLADPGLPSPNDPPVPPNDPPAPLKPKRKWL